MALTSLRQSDPVRIGRFRLTARLGAGGMGVVYLGEAKGFGPVAIKVIRPEAGDEDEFRARFRREVALLARVQGLCTVRVIEADTESTSPFLVTEYAEGPSLSEHVKRNGPLEPEMLCGLAAGLAEALVAIHHAGVVHRDLKPSNVILTATGPKVIDFGIAQAQDGTVMTRTGMAMGSPGFMAPEQIAGESGPTADVFAWGLTVAYAASGRHPFGSGPAEVLPYRILHGSPDIDSVPAVLVPLVEAAVVKNPNARPTAAELLAQLTAGVSPAAAVRDAQPEDVDSARTQLVLARTWHPPPEVTPMAEARAARRSRSRSRMLIVASVAVPTMIGIGVAYTLEFGWVVPGAPSSASVGRPHAATQSPTVTFGGFTGREPSTIAMNSTIGGGTIQDIRWTSWTAAGAAGTGRLGSAVTRIELSEPVDGRFTRMDETTDEQMLVQTYPDNDWPTGATAATVAGCSTPTAAQMLSAFRTATQSVQDGWASPGNMPIGFDQIQCWREWIVAHAIGNGDSDVVFSLSGGLHLMPETDIQEFSDIICGDPTSPEVWKGPDTGPAVC